MASTGTATLTASWVPNGTCAWLADADGESVGRIELAPWYARGARKAEEAWIVTWFEGDGDDFILRRALVEMPAFAVDSDAREAELIAAAEAALQRGEEPPMPRASRLPAPPSASERFRQAELLIDAWDAANGRLWEATRDESAAAKFRRYEALTESLARVYTVDRTLDGMWSSLPPDVREDASCRADDRARRAIEHNRAVSSRFSKTYDPRADASFDAYFERESTGAPYTHWTGHLLTGSLQKDFFEGLHWVRGQMTYRGIIDPIELWQYTAGAEPRWKWKDSQAISLDAGAQAQREAYDRFLAGRDVLGLFSHFLEVFWDAKWSFRKLMLRAERRRPGMLR